ncbi:putative ABC transport system permease protein [Clostridium collagenovorans DSM 3089]|uniref:Putative ABC transport system permease protein n=1 Tax=Clostridium collagenovorans DSM 3089 TaxID=1121306 RepID=A0A1M5S5G0_9CLOT|nr:ABC transporter ATP-binding protein/permease [Clostridium collagenovorans]SHH33203.1 putative ABC transport system permease protein [Clostridium collagenovorans DSM 3089]
MLQIEKISKKYITGDLEQTALDEVSLNLRDNEFVAILGPSGSGKTTLLNVIGGLDRYDSGDLIINGISTKKYKDRDWDSYRNHTVGFVFQSYNLIPHQSVLANVELALTISGISKVDRKRRATEALEKVGLGKHLHKKPNQMSGGQMQRVAIARALVNDPKILLADEPTGALDSETSVQVMDLLKEVAKDRLVVMVTHNPELAEEYANRIVKVKDGHILDDSNPFQLDSESMTPPKHETMGKASMSLLTSLSLSFNNLKTKKGRTFLTAFAGSIGIIGIALILSLSNGVNTYIDDIQKDTMTSYPISIEAESIDLSSIMASGGPGAMHNKELNHNLDEVYSNGSTLEMASTMTSSFTKNNLTEFKKFLDNPNSEINKYIGENGIIYSYNTKFGVYTKDPNGTLVNTDGSTLSDTKDSNTTMNNGMPPMPPMGPMSMMPGMSSSSNNFEELLPGKDGVLASPAITDSYDVIYGDWPNAYDEVILVLDKNNEIATNTLYQLGILPSSEYKEIMNKIENGEAIKIENKSWKYEDICNKEFYMIPDSDTYVKNSNGTFKSIKEDTTEMDNLLNNAVKLKVTGVVRPKEDAKNASISSAIGYTKALTDYLINYANESEIVKAQKDSPTINVLSGLEFSPNSDEDKVKDAKKYLENLGVSDKAKFFKNITSSMQPTGGSSRPGAPSISTMSEAQLAGMLDEYLKSPDNDTLLKIYDAYISTGTYDENMSDFGAVSLDAPSSINIYTDSFENKENISNAIKDYNANVSKEDQINYTDYIGLLLSSVTTIINVISYVLIAFVAVSLVVSSIMIGIITFISVMKRTKEIGILRAIGASKHNISQVFNAETLIIGLCSGVLGVVITLLLLIPINSIIHAVLGNDTVNASLPFVGAIILIILSVILTLIGGFIPSKKAAKKDPVIALRTE